MSETMAAGGTRQLQIWRGDLTSGELVDYTLETEPGMVVLDAVLGRASAASDNRGEFYAAGHTSLPRQWPFRASKVRWRQNYVWQKETRCGGGLFIRSRELHCPGWAAAKPA